MTIKTGTVDKLPMKPRCQHCGAYSKEAHHITISHAPHTATFRIVNMKKEVQDTYQLCRHCHDIYGELEKQILREACDKMRKLHQEFVSQ